MTAAQHGRPGAITEAADGRADHSPVSLPAGEPGPETDRGAVLRWALDLVGLADPGELAHTAPETRPTPARPIVTGLVELDLRGGAPRSRRRLAGLDGLDVVLRVDRDTPMTCDVEQALAGAARVTVIADANPAVMRLWCEFVHTGVHPWVA